MRARTRERPRPDGREQPPSDHTVRVRGLRPRTLRAKRRTQFRAKAKLLPGSGFAPAAEDQAAEGEAQSERADGEAADR